MPRLLLMLLAVDPAATRNPVALREAAMRVVPGCVEQIALRDAELFARFGSTILSFCGTNVSCDTMDGSVFCGSPDEGMERAGISGARKYLSFETGCSLEKVELMNSYLGSYRLDACGRQYICTNYRGKVDCRPPLAVIGPHLDDGVVTDQAIKKKRQAEEPQIRPADPSIPPKTTKKPLKAEP